MSVFWGSFRGGGGDRLQVSLQDWVCFPFFCLIVSLFLPARRPSDVKKLVVKPTGVRKDAAPATTTAVPAEATADE